MTLEEEDKNGNGRGERVESPYRHLQIVDREVLFFRDSPSQTGRGTTFMKVVPVKVRESLNSDLSFKPSLCLIVRYYITKVVCYRH